MAAKNMKENKSVLVIAGFGIWVDGTPRVSKIETHIQPIADTVEKVVYVCRGPTSDQTEEITYHTVESRFKIIGILKQLLVMLRLLISDDYDLIVSFSLIPYGIFALVGKFSTRTPAHLGIIGGDLDVHATAWYGPVVRWLFRRFDVVTVAGQEFKDRLVAMGVPKQRIFTVLHPVADTFAKKKPATNPTYDILWLTRMSPEKDPLRFVEVLTELNERSVPFSAAMVGAGDMTDEVRAAIAAQDLSGDVDLPGWADEPVEYYQDARLYVLTSKREMLPLTLVEAMFVGVPPVVSSVGAIPDLVNDGQNGVLIEDRSVAGYADAIEELLLDGESRKKLAKSTSNIKRHLSYEAVAQSWEEIIVYVDNSPG